jgi:hypothetical protein
MAWDVMKRKAWVYSYVDRSPSWMLNDIKAMYKYGPIRLDLLFGCRFREMDQLLAMIGVVSDEMDNWEINRLLIH